MVEGSRLKRRSYGKEPAGECVGITFKRKENRDTHLFRRLAKAPLRGDRHASMDAYGGCPRSVEAAE